MPERFVGMDRILDRFASVAMIVAAITLLWVVLSDRGSEAVPGSAAVEGLDEAEVVDPPPRDSVRGNPDARVAIVEFSDFECPFCGRYARDVYPRLAEDYVDTGKVQYVFRHYPLDSHPFAAKAAEAVECAARQGMYWEMRDLLFQVPPARTEADLFRYAVSLGLRLDDFETCIESAATAKRVMEDRRHGEALGVVATPTFFFAEVQDDGKLSLVATLKGVRPYSTFQSALDELLAATARARLEVSDGAGILSPK